MNTMVSSNVRLTCTRGAAAVVIVCALFLMGAISPASACSRTFEEPYGLELSYDEIFLAMVERVQARPLSDNSGSVLVADYRLVEMFKGFPPITGQITEIHHEVHTSCDPRVLGTVRPGDAVLFYVHLAPEAPDMRRTGIDSHIVRGNTDYSSFLESLREFRSENL
ncbi:hypothetical protein [Luteimonas sp. R10]|uniref:hypothetical protein n=1 Tax=Luteimonas sp. R10 TaxID=3108176 RepID=UPI0030851F67|nr:hypothetical protein U3649_09385 [Luteimonas sp. R10]